MSFVSLTVSKHTLLEKKFMDPHLLIMLFTFDMNNLLVGLEVAHISPSPLFCTCERIVFGLIFIVHLMDFT
jgi:hypothetical protein